MTNNTSHYMVSNKINRLIVVHLVKGPCGGVAIMRFPCNSIFFIFVKCTSRIDYFLATCSSLSTPVLLPNLTIICGELNSCTSKLDTCKSTKLFRKFIKLINAIYEGKVEANKPQWKDFNSKLETTNYVIDETFANE